MRRRSSSCCSGNQARNFGDGRGAEQVLERDARRECFIDVLQELKRQQGVAAELKKVVVDADAIEAQSGFPYPGQFLFNVAAGRFIVRRYVGTMVKIAG